MNRTTNTVSLPEVRRSSGTDHRPIRVLYLVPDLRIGGAERHATTLMPALDPERFEPYVLCIGEEGELFRNLDGTGVHARALGRTKRQTFVALLDLSREFKRIAPHVVLTRGYNAETLGRLASWRAKVPHTVVWVHNHGETGERGPLRRLIDRALDGRTSAYFGVAFAQIDYMVGELGYPRNKIQIIHNGVDPASIDFTDDRTAVRELGVGDDEHVITMVAALRPEKDHHNFLRAARVVLESQPTTRFLIVGDGPLRQELVGAAHGLGIGKQVVFTGARSDIPALLRGTDVFVLSSATVECLPIALLEAMAAGRPAVCTAVGGVPEMIIEGGTGYTVPAQNPRALASRLIELLSDPSTRQRMGAEARRRLESDFSLKASVSLTETSLKQLIRSTVPASTRPLVLSVVLDLTSVGGVEVLLLNLFKHFDPLRIRPRLVCLREAGPLAGDFTAAGFEVEVLDRRGRYDTKTLGKLIRSFRRSATDVVLVSHHHRASLLLGRAAARLAGVPANVIAAHDMDLTSVGGRVLPAWAVSTLCMSDALVLLTPTQGRYLHQEEKVGRGFTSTVREVIIHNGIVIPPQPTEAARSVARCELGVDAEHFVIGIVARLSAQKAHEVMFAAMASLLESHPHARLMVIGGGDREEELRDLALSLGIEHATEFLGIRSDVPRLLPGLDVSCLSSAHEGVPLAIIESMAAGLPVVATNCGSMVDLVTEGETGFLVPVRDAGALVERLRQIADDEVLRARLGAAGRAHAENKFAIQETARRYERLFGELVERNGGFRGRRRWRDARHG